MASHRKQRDIGIANIYTLQVSPLKRKFAQLRDYPMRLFLRIRI